MIDIHAHMIPPVYRDMLKRHDALFEDGFPVPEWTLAAHMEFNEKAGITRSLLSVSSPHPYFGDAAESREVCRAINEYGAACRKSCPEMFGFAACLPLPDAEGAAAEAVYSLDVLKADAVKLASNSRGLYLGDPAMEPLFDELNSRKAIVLIHPHKPEPMKEGVFTAGPVPLFEFLCDTTRAVLNLIASGTTARYPNVRFVVPHCGSFLPNIYDRLQGISQILVPLGKMPEINVKEEFSKLWFDTAGSPVPDLLNLLETFAAPEKIIFGSDYPYTPENMALKNGENLKAFLRGRADEEWIFGKAAGTLLQPITIAKIT